MEIGLIKSYDKAAQVGSLVSTEGQELTFGYINGQNMIFSNSGVTPQFSGRHEQPDGYSLKLPSEGDSVVFRKYSNGLVATWSYLYHFTDSAERHYPSIFCSLLIEKNKSWQ